MKGLVVLAALVFGVLAIAYSRRAPTVKVGNGQETYKDYAAEQQRMDLEACLDHADHNFDHFIIINTNKRGFILNSLSELGLKQKEQEMRECQMRYGR
jgi:hypothetical protein